MDLYSAGSNWRDQCPRYEEIHANRGKQEDEQALLTKANRCAELQCVRTGVRSASINLQGCLLSKAEIAKVLRGEPTIARAFTMELSEVGLYVSVLIDLQNLARCAASVRTLKLRNAR